GASKVVVPAGVTLTLDYPLTGKIDLEGNAALNINTDVTPALGKLSATSVVTFNAGTTIPVNTYGHVVVGGAGTKAFESGATTILGNLTVGPNAVLKGAPGNESQLTIGGNLVQQTVSPLVAADNRIGLRFTDNAAHTIATSSNLFLYSLQAGINSSITVSAPVAVRIVLGSLNGGGLLLPSSSSLSVQSHSLQVIGAGTINPSSETGTIQIASGDLKVASTAPANSNVYFDATNHSIDSLVVDVSGGQLHVRSPLTIESAILIRSGALDGGGFVTLKADSEKSAVLAEIGTGGSYTGNLRVQQFIPYIQDQRIALASSVAGVTVANWQSYFPITGPFAGASGGSSEPSMFIFNGSAMTPYPASGGSNSAPIEKGKGYQAKIVNAGPVTLETNGNPHQGSIAIPLIGNQSSTFDGGWNLVGNPYASSIAWTDSASAFTRSGIANTIAVREDKIVEGVLIGQYQYYSADLGKATIPLGRAFWVRAISPSPSLTIHEKAKAAVQAFEPAGEVSHLQITMRQGLKQDHTYILFGDQFTDGLDPQFDFPKKSNEGLFNIATSIGGASAAINALSKSFCSTSVPLIMANAPVGNYSLHFDGISSLSDIGHVTL
ncbi:MAG TPA: hypothetical protein VGD31_08600, partial [Sphingobacteriaceae bacterium]